ncbi:hypothetical protein QNN00_19475 [Bacillus velezensis]|nr:hypothetical protein [Bacillus velezensis]
MGEGAGSIQNDTFVRDLVMIANDVNEIKPKPVKTPLLKAKNGLSFICILR